jgi:hypothetical protein
MDLVYLDANLAGLRDGNREVYKRTFSEASWTWAAFTRLGNPLGFLSLSAKPNSAEFVDHVGPHLNLACRRDKPHAQYIPESIIALLDWLRTYQLCAGIHADHAQSDLQLAAWLLEAGFVYNGCRGEHGRLEMVCLL